MANILLKGLQNYLIGLISIQMDTTQFKQLTFEVKNSCSGEVCLYCNKLGYKAWNYWLKTNGFKIQATSTETTRAEN